MWKNLDADAKETYYSAARKADEEHKLKYPGYYYSPKEARIRKGLKRRFAGGSGPVDALRFVKVFMSSSEKGNLVAEEPKSLLRKLQPKPDEDQNTVSPSTQMLPLDKNEVIHNTEISKIVDSC